MLKKPFSLIYELLIPCWDYTPTNANQVESPGVFPSEKTSYLNTINEIYLKDDVINGSVVNGIRERMLFNFILNIPPGYKVSCESETKHFKK